MDSKLKGKNNFHVSLRLTKVDHCLDMMKQPGAMGPITIQNLCS